MFIDSCLLYDFADKGVSMGVKVDVTVSNCLIYAVDSGVAVKDDSIAGIYNNTIVGNNFGYRCYNKANPASPSGGGYITNSYNNVLWSNGETISLMNGSTLAASYCDFQATNYPGIGNFDSDPLFVNPAQRDYRVAANSPTIGAGLGGANLGATFPVGAAMAPSHPRIESFAAESGALKLRFYVDPEKTYTVQYRDVLGSGSWQKLTDVYPQPLPRLAEVADTIPAIGNRFYRLVSPKQP